MAYETGNATGQSNLISKLATFMGVNMPSWTILKNGINGSYYELVVTKGPTYITVLHDTTSNYMLVYQSTGDSASPTDKPGRPYRTNSPSSSTILYCYTETNVSDTVDSYYFFSNAAEDYVHVCVGITPTYFTHFGLGQSQLQAVPTNLNKGYCYGTHWHSTQDANQDNPLDVRNGKIGVGSFDFNTQDSGIQIAYDDGVNTKFFSNTWSVSTNDAQGSLPMYFDFINSDLALLLNNTRPTFANNTVIVPITPRVRNNLGDGINRIHITVPDIGFCNLVYNNVGDEITVGSDTWVLFPWRTKDLTEYSEFFGYAYKKII